MARIVIHKSRKKAVVVTVIGFLLGMAGGLFLQYTDQTVVGWCFIIAAVFTLIYGFGSMFDRRPYVILDEQGITELFSIREQIEWQAIRYTDDFYFRGQYFVRMLLDRNYKPHLIRPPWFWRFDRIYGREGMKAVYIRTSGLEINSMRLAELIRRMTQADNAGKAELLHRYGPKRGDSRPAHELPENTLRHR